MQRTAPNFLVCKHGRYSMLYFRNIHTNAGYLCTTVDGQWTWSVDMLTENFWENNENQKKWQVKYGETCLL